MNPDCQAFREKLSAYMEGELEPAERDAVTGHLGRCGACAQELGALRQMLQEMKQVPAIQVPADFRREFWAKVEGPPREQPLIQRVLEPWYLKIPVGALATAAVVLLAVRITGVVPNSLKVGRIPISAQNPVNSAASVSNLMKNDQRRRDFSTREKDRASSDDFNFRGIPAAPVAANEVEAPVLADGPAKMEARQLAPLERQMTAGKSARPAPSEAVPAPVARAVNAGPVAHRYVLPAPFPMDTMQPGMRDHDAEQMEQAKEPGLPGLRLRVRLYARDLAAADGQLRRLLAEIPAKLVEPPLPIHYELQLPPELVETFLERLKPIGSSMDLQQEGVASPMSDSPAQITLDILSADSR